MGKPSPSSYPRSRRPKAMKRALREVIEIVADDDERGERTYRAVYTVRLADSVYVLHAFEKKSRHGSRH